MIETKQYHLTKNIYTKIILLKRIKKQWWFYLFIIASAITPYFFNKESELFILILVFAYPFLTLGYIYYWVNSKGKSYMFEKTKMSFDSVYMLFIENDNESKIPFKNIKHLAENENYWLLYITNREFLYISKNIFYSKKDYNYFKSLITKQ